MRKTQLPNNDFPLDHTLMALIVDFPQFNKNLSKCKAGKELSFSDLYKIFLFISNHSDTNYFILLSERLAHINKSEVQYIGKFIKEQSEKALKILNKWNDNISVTSVIKNYFKYLPAPHEKLSYDIDYYLNESDSLEIKMQKYVQLKDYVSANFNEVINKKISPFLDALLMSQYFNKPSIEYLMSKFNQIGLSILRDLKDGKEEED